MTAPTVTQSEAAFKAAIDELDEFEKFAQSASPNAKTLFEVSYAINVYDNLDACSAALAASRATLERFITPASVVAHLAPFLAQMAQAVGAPTGLASTPAEALYWIREYWVTNSKSVNAREFSRGAVAAGGSNVGTGTVRILKVDDEGFELEGSHAEVKTFECIQDQLQTDKHRELFSVRGAVPEVDLLKVSGSGPWGTIRALTTRDTAAFFANPTFSQWAATAPSSSEVVAAATTSLTNWTITTAANAYISDTKAYRDFPSETAKYSLKFTGLNGITQTLNTTKNPVFISRTPYYLQFAVYRGSSCDGTLTTTFGAVTLATSMSGLGNNAWTVVTMPLTKNLYHRNFKANDSVISFVLSAWTTGYMHLDDIVCGPMTLIDGAYYVVVGAVTPFSKKDTFTFTDTVNATRGVIQYWLFHRSNLWKDPLLGGFCLPSNAAAGETVTDP